jgi:hypothetical protein
MKDNFQNYGFRQRFFFFFLIRVQTKVAAAYVQNEK